MDYYEFMYRIEHDDDPVLNLPESGIGGALELWDEESCDDFFLGADPYIPLY